MNAAAHHDAHPHDHGHEDPLAEITLRGYVTGFILSVLLTAVPFWLVMHKVIPSPSTTIVVLLTLGVIQIVVHMVYFLHMNAHSESGWNLLALVFTMVLVFITLSGSIWIMYHLNKNMMPMSIEQSRNMP
jgi:cytochrome o ubiquinol oxidase operon protein cyoD